MYRIGADGHEIIVSLTCKFSVSTISGAEFYYYSRIVFDIPAVIKVTLIFCLQTENE